MRYSDKELQLIKHFELSNAYLKEVGAFKVYQEMALRCFRQNRQDSITDSVKRCLEAFYEMTPSRLTKEFDDLIQLGD